LVEPRVSEGIVGDPGNYQSGLLFHWPMDEQVVAQNRHINSLTRTGQFSGSKMWALKAGLAIA
jgi:hypothetical protein